MANGTLLDELMAQMKKNKQTPPVGSLSPSAPKTSNYETMFKKALDETYRYAQVSPQTARDVANTITPGGAMTAYARGDVKSFDWDEAIQAERDRASATDYFRKSGLYDNDDYLYNDAYRFLVGDDYLKKQQFTLLMGLAASSARDGLEDVRRSLFKNDPRAEWRNFYDLYGYETEQPLEIMLRAEAIAKGTNRTVRDFDLMDDETYDREYEALETWYEGLDPVALTERYESQTDDYLAKIKTVDKEISRRSEIDEFRAGIRSNEDYGTMSAFTGSGLPEGAWSQTRAVTQEDIDALNDPYSFINSGATWEQLTNSREKLAYVAEYMDAGYNMLTPDEIADYNYLINTGREDDAARYLELLRPELLLRRAMVAKSWQTVKATNPALAVPTWLEAGIQNLSNIAYLPYQMYEAATGRDDPFSPAFDALNKSEWTSEAQLGWIEDSGMADWLKDVTSVVYKGASGWRDNVIRLAASGFNPTVSLIIAGAQATSGSLHESSERDDVSGAAKIVKALAIGAIEMGTEKIGLDALFSKGHGGALEYLKGVILSELGEESLNYISEPALEAAVAFLFDHEAEIMSGPEFWNGLTDTMLITAISSLLMGGDGAIQMDAGNRRAGKGLRNDGDVESVLQIAEGLGADTISAQIAKAIRAAEEGGKKVTTRELGKLVSALSSDIGEQNATAVNAVYEDAIADRLIELGEEKSKARKQAKVIRRISAGEVLSVAERMSVNWSDNESQVVRELTTEAREGDEGRVGRDWKVRAVQLAEEASAPYVDKGALFEKALRTKPGAPTETQAAAPVTPDAVVQQGEEMAASGKNKFGPKPLIRAVAFDVDGTEQTGEVVRFEKGKDGMHAVVATTADGKTANVTVDLESITASASAGIGSIVRYVQNASTRGHDMSAAEASTMIRLYEQEGGDAKTFIDGFEKAYLAGYAGIELDSAGISEGVAKIAFDQGKAEAAADEKGRVARATRVRADSKGVVSWLGKVSSGKEVRGTGDPNALSAAMRKMTSSQRTTVQIVQAFADKFKTNVVLFESSEENIGSIENGSYDPNTNTIYIDINSGADSAESIKASRKHNTLGHAMVRTLGHELTHHLESTSPEAYATYKQAVKTALKEQGQDWATLVRGKLDTARNTGRKLTYAGAEAEVIADASEYMLQNSKFVKEIDNSTKGRVKKFIKDFMKKLGEVFSTLTRAHTESAAIRKEVDGVKQYMGNLQQLWDAAMEESMGMETSMEAEADTEMLPAQHQARVGYTSEGIPVYRSNFPEGSTQPERQARILSLVQNMWAKNPISLEIVRDGKPERIVANFDPWVDPEGKVVSDATKLAFGNRKGTKSDRKTTQKLADDFPEIILSSTYDRPGNEVGKTTYPHQGVVVWHYFANRIGFINEAGGYAEYNISIDVKEREDGHYVYSFAAVKEKGSERNNAPSLYSSPGTMNAPVSGSGISPATADNSVAQSSSPVKPEFDDDSSPDGIEVDDDTESAYPVQNSVRTWGESDYVTHRNEAAERLAKAIGVSVGKAKKWIDDVNSVSAYILGNKARLDYIPTAVKGMSAFKSNPEYGGSIDMSTICAKRRLATGTLDAIQRVLGDAVLTKDDFLHIREMMKERGYEVACGLCFVESSRKNLSKYNRQFLDQYKAEHPDGDLGMVDLNTVEGLERIRSNPETADVYAAYEKFMNKLAQRKPKLFEKRTEYNHEILKKFKSDTTVGIKNRNGGLRLQSFSDFEIVHLIDMMQVITDMASVGLAGQAYTKVPDFAWALGDTGLKINLSLIAKDVDADGNLVFDDIEGMNHEEAKRLRDSYSKNVGTIVVTFTDEQTIAAMKSDFIDYIIPFHRSQWQKGDYKKLGLPEGTKDYTLHQNEKEGRKRVKENFLPNAYWDFSVSGKQNAINYLNMCAEAGRTPKFAKFLDKQADGSYRLKEDGSTDGYWKLLIDFKMYDNAGVGSPQLAVQPDFNMDQAMRMLEEYKGEHDTFPVAQDVVDDFVKEYRGDVGGVKASDGRYTVSPIQQSARDLPPEVTAREFLTDADSSIAETVEERNALSIYQGLLMKHADASDKVIAAERVLAAADEADLPEARKALTVARARQKELYNRLLNVERTAHVQTIVKRTNRIIGDLSGKDKADVDNMVSTLQARLESLRLDLQGLKGAAKTQREADIRAVEREMANLQNKAVNALLATNEKYTKRIADLRERNELNAEIGKKARHIKRVVKRLNDRIIHEEDYKNVKEPLKPAVHNLVRAFIDGFGSLVFDQKTASKLKSVYDVLAQDDATVEYYDDEVSDWLTTLADLSRQDEERRVSGSTLENLNDKLYTYTTLADIADHVAHMVAAADTMFMEGKDASVSGLVEDIGDALLAKEDRRELAGALGKAASFADNLIIRGNMMPQFFFEGLNNKGMMRLYDDLQNGVQAYSERLHNGQTFLENAMRRHGYHAWGDMNKTVEFKTKQGHIIRLKRENMMWIYATAKREASNPLMDTHHLDEGGFVYEESSVPTEGLFKAKGHQQHHKIVQEDVKAITEMLTEEQIAFMDECVEFLSTECADWGNEASMQLFGIKKYKESYYFPFKVDSDQLYKNSAAGSTSTTSDARVKHISFSHSIKKGANTPLVMGEFTSTIADHINQMATYSGLVVPIENMNRVLNRKVDDDGDMVTIRSLFSRKHGSPSSKYVDDLLKDLNGGPQTDNRGAWDAGIRLFKKNAVVGKLSVALQQPTAITRAFAYINPRWFANLRLERPKVTWKRMMKYSGTAVLKDMGGFNVGLGQGAKNWIERGDLGDYNVFKRAKFLLDQKGLAAAKDEWVDFLTGLPGWMDKVTWISIWNAVENEQAHRNPGMDRNSDEFLRTVGARFDDVINHTQVYDSILSKSQNMRSKNALAKMATSFMAESTLNMNLAYRAFASKDVKQIGRVVSSLLLNAALGAAAYALVGAFNKDDDDRTLEERYAVAFAGRLADNLNPLASIPYLSDIWNKIQGYDVERTDLSYVLDLAEDGMKFFDKIFNPDEALSYRDYENFVGGMFAAVTGIPAKNWMGDARRVWNMMHVKTENAPSSRVWYGILDEILPWRETNNTSYYDRYLAALKDGDKQEQYDLKDYMLSTKGVSEETFVSGVRNAYKKEFLRGGISKEDGAAFLLAHGLVSGETAEKKKQSAFQYVDKWVEGTDGYSVYNTLENAFAGGNSSQIQSAWSELENNGYTEKRLQTQTRTILKELVKSGKISPAQATEILRRYSPYKDDKNNVKYPQDWLNEKE